MPSLKVPLIAGLSLLAVLSVPARAAEPVSNTLTVNHVVALAGGSERLEAAATARPGELLQYTAQFHNAGAGIARGLTATLPIPAGVVLVPGSIRPTGAQASLDGTTFAALPLTRHVRRADGSDATERVPLAEYRYLRWSPADLATNATYAVSARVVVAGTEVTSTR